MSTASFKISMLHKFNMNASLEKKKSYNLQKCLSLIMPEFNVHTLKNTPTLILEIATLEPMSVVKHYIIY